MSEHESDLKTRLAEAMKAAMRARERERLAVIRQLMSAFKQYEVDHREALDDAGALAVLDKQLKQRRESIEQYRDAGRDDLAEREAFEIGIIEEFLPEPLSDEALAALIDNAIEATGATSMRDMGRLMARLRPEVAGRAEMARVSAAVKDRLAG